MKKFSLLITLLSMLFFTNTVLSQIKRYVKPVASGNGSGSSWANASSNLQAIMDISAIGDEVWMARGTYLPPTNSLIVNALHNPSTDPRNRSFVVKQGLKLYGGFAGTEGTLGQRNLSGAKTILSGDLLGNDLGFTSNADNAYHVLLIFPSADDVILDAVSIVSGNTSGIPETYYKQVYIDTTYYYPLTNDGAGIYSYYGDFDLDHCIMSNNYSTGRGGAVYAYWGNRFENWNCIFTNNYATNGAVAYYENLSGTLNYFTNCSIVNNSSPNYIIHNENGSNTVRNSIMWNNSGTNVRYSISANYSIIQGYPPYLPWHIYDDDPMFINLADPDGIDNILGTSDDGIIPQCGRAIGGSEPPPYAILNNTASAKDIRGALRWQNGEKDMGAYETALRQQLTELEIRPDQYPLQYCKNKTVSFYTFGMGNGGVYQWKINNVNVGTNSNRFSTTQLNDSDRVTCVVSSPAGCGSATVITSNELIVRIAAGLPVTPARITGPANACLYLGTNNLARYSVPKVTNAQTYYWHVSSYPNSPQLDIVSNPWGDTTVLVSFHSDFTGGTVHLEAISYCGSSFQSFSIVRSMVLRTPGTITGPTEVCSFMQSATHPTGIPVTYSIKKVTDANSYIWSVPAGATISSHPGGTGENDTAIVVIYSSSFVSGAVSVQAANGCTSTPLKSLSISKKTAATPGTITGPTEVCSLMQSPSNPAGTLATYTIRKVKYATFYSWTLPPGTTATHPAGSGELDTIIKVIYSNSFTGGPITVTANTNCNTSALRSLTITRSLPSSPGTITGPTDACPLMQSATNPTGIATNYTIRKVSTATSYTWTIPTGATATHPAGVGVNDTIVTVTYNSSFTSGLISVVSNSNCGSSTVRSLSITRKLPSTPGTITASVPTACPQRRVTYSLASMPSNATSILWTVPASGTIISGQGTLSLVVQYTGATLATDSIKAAGATNCATSSQRKLKVGVLSACPGGKNNEEPMPAVTLKNNTSELNNNTGPDITVTPNPSQQQFSLHVKVPDINTMISMQVFDVTGRLVETRQNIRNNQQVIIGENYKPGIYFATFIQEEKKKIIRLIKL